MISAHHAPSGASPLAVLRRFLERSILAPIRRRIEIGRAYRELASLDDRQLADIGVHRSEIARLVRGEASPAELRATRESTPANSNSRSRHAA